MRLLFTITTLFAFSFVQLNYACDCGPLDSEEDLDDKVYSGANYIFFTGEVLSIEKAFHMEVKIQIDKIFYGNKHVNDISKPITIYVDLRTACAVQAPQININEKFFITAAYNSMGRMFISNSCDAFFSSSKIDELGLRDYLENLQSELNEG